MQRRVGRLVAQNGELADRVRDALAIEQPVREVKMFGGLAFMVDGSMVVSVGSDGGLLVRSDPEEADTLFEIKGARPAEMGAGRAMGNGWISVAGEAIAGDEDLDFWIGVALEYKDREATGTRSRGRPKRGPR